MSLLYKKKENVIYSAEIREREDDDSIDINFYADCGKHGTDESLDSYEITPKELLDLLQKHYYDENGV